MDLLNKAMADADPTGTPDAAAIVGSLLGQFGASSAGGDAGPSPASAVAGVPGLVDQLEGRPVGPGELVGLDRRQQAGRCIGLSGAIPADMLGGLSKQFGIPVEALLPVIAAALPTVIDALTPDGKVEQGGSGGGGIDLGGMRRRAPERQQASSSASGGCPAPQAAIGSPGNGKPCGPSRLYGSWRSSASFAADGCGRMLRAARGRHPTRRLGVRAVLPRRIRSRRPVPAWAPRSGGGGNVAQEAFPGCIATGRRSPV